MTVQKLRTKLRRHNALQIGLGATLAAIAPWLWIGSFCTARWLFYYPAEALGLGTAWETSLYVAWGFIGLLAWEGLRRSGRVFDLLEYAESDFNWYKGPSMWYSSPQRPDPMAYAWILTQLLFLAPRATVLAIESLRAVVRASPAVIDQAAAVFNALKADRRWHSASDFADRGPALGMLARLRLIWVQEGDDGLEVRFPAAMSEAELV